MTDYADLEKRLREDAAGHATTSEVFSGEEHSAISHRLARLSKQRASMLTEAADALASLTRELEEAKGALKPFAKLVDQWADRLPDATRIGGSQVLTDDDPHDLRFEHEYTMGDLRRAGRCLSSATSEKDSV